MMATYYCPRCGQPVDVEEVRRALSAGAEVIYCSACVVDPDFEIGAGELSDAAQRRLERMDDDRPVYARRHGSGYRLLQIHFVPQASEQYQREERRLLKEGWRRVVND